MHNVVLAFGCDLLCIEDACREVELDQVPIGVHVDLVVEPVRRHEPRVLFRRVSLLSKI